MPIKSDFSFVKWSFGWKALKTKNHFTIIGDKWELRRFEGSSDDIYGRDGNWPIGAVHIGKFRS